MKTIAHSSKLQELDKDFQPEGYKMEIKEGRLKKMYKAKKSLGKRKGHSRPKPDASQFKEGHCSCCTQAHLTPECPKFKSLSNQKQFTIIRRDKLCYHCIEGPHPTKDCKKNEGKLCGIDGCKLYHHRVLHRKLQSESLRASRLKTE